MKYYKGNEKQGLTPVISDWMKEIMNYPALIDELIDKYGSPVNLHHLPTFRKNINQFKKVFENHGLDFQIFYARKANKSKSLVSKAFECGIGVDTASYNELNQCISLGGEGNQLVLTSAIKTAAQIELAILHQVPIILDNYDECKLTIGQANKMNQKAIIGFRISGFIVEGKKLYSRFGFDIDNAYETITSFTKEVDNDLFEIRGLHFHLDGYSVQQRAEAILACIELTSQLKTAGVSIRFIDMGGGILINYLESEKEWNTFIDTLKNQVIEEENTLTFNNNGLGFHKINNELYGSLNTYPFFNKVNGVDFLRNILCYRKSEEKESVVEQLKSSGIQLRLEPGRSLLSQVGMTIARVAHRKQDSKGQWLVGLEMNMSQMMSSSADFLLDPFIMYQQPIKKGNEVDVFFTGAYCLERDVLLKRKIRLPQLPEIGDKVAFVNTAGYMMHFFETEAHLFDLSANLYFKEGRAFTIESFKMD